MTAHATRPAERRRASSLEAAGLTPQRAVHWNLGPPELYEHAVRRAEGVIAEGGAFCAVTAPHTGRSPNDKFIVREPSSEVEIRWNRLNQPLEAAHFERLRAAVLTHLAGQELFVRDLFAGADAEHRFGIRFVTPNAWHALFVHNMFLRPSPADLASFSPAWMVLHAPELHADPGTHGTKSGTFVVIHFGQRTILIGGTRYAGEMKKSVFTILNYLLPKRGILSMHCSANLGRAGDVALFFGLSGTGKTTLSADPDRALIGDDEHGWSDRGIFNFEGGCYAKVIRLSREGEPEIFATTRMFGTVLENVVEHAGGRENLGLALARQADDLRVAAALEVENPPVGPAVLVVPDERPFRVGGEGRLSGARQAEEQRDVARPAEVGGAVHREHAAPRQQVVENRKDRLFHLARVARAADQDRPLREMDDHERARLGAVGRGIGVEFRRVEHDPGG